MSQLVGSSCTFCGKQIGSILDGDFCSSCGNPYHDKCRPSEVDPFDSKVCAECGSDISQQIAQRLEEQRVAAEFKKRMPADRIRGAMLCMHIVAFLLVIPVPWLMLNSQPGAADWDLVLYLSSVFVVLAAFVEAVSWGLYQGQSWARTAALTLLVLSVFSCAFPVAVTGLALLAN